MSTIRRNSISSSLSRTAIATGVLLCSAMASPSFAATLTVGSGKAFATPCKAFAAAAAGDVIEIDGATAYVGDVCGIYPSNLVIRGVNGRPRIDAGGANAMGKGTWVVIGNGITIENVEMFGARVTDRNGAALRLEGTGFTLRSSFLHDNENGILSGANTASDILIENTEFGFNGYGDGYTHNLYIGNVRSLTFRYNYSHDANVGHNLKSRAQTNTIAYNRFSSTPAGQASSGKPSYEVDLPNAGNAIVIGNVIQQPSANNNPAMLAYGEEGASNPGQNLYVVNNTFLNDDSTRGTFVMVGSGVTAPVLLQNNIVSGVGTLSTQTAAIDRSNYRSLAPAFVDRANYDLRPAAGSPMVDAGTNPGSSITGLSLVPVAQYKHRAGSEVRPVSGALDIGAYEASTATTEPAPAPAPAPAPTTDVTAPTVQITSPVGGRISGTITIMVQSADNSGPAGIVNQLYIDGGLVASNNGSSLSYKWSTQKVAKGTHTIKAVARDAAGNVSSTSVQVTK
jgi:hypothetical protein